ncbi:MAG: AMP-binding protein, partial [Actinomycetota bacterium]|nr:AMP-binding protein [Actinomycetota bacterium]
SPALIRLARSGPLLRANTVQTPAFVRATTALSGPRMPRSVAAAFAAPYRGSGRREAIGAFVADIPLEPGHPSAAALDQIAEGIRTLDLPALLLWGPGDPVFADRYLHDLIDRLPQADVHRYEGARHLVSEDAPALVDDLWTWIADQRAASWLLADVDGIGGTAGLVQASPDVPIWAGLSRRAAQTPGAVALAEPHDGGWRRVTWSLLARQVDLLAAGLAARGIRRGDRVAVLIPPGADLIAVVYACWRIGASVVVTDAGLGVRGIHRALRGAWPRHVIGIPKGLALVRATRIPGARIAVRELPAIARLGQVRPMPAPPGLRDEAVVVFTSGSTGPAKGVVYRHGQVQRTRDLLAAHYSLDDSDALVAAFAPWAVLGPALGIASVIPDMDVSSPRTLTASALAAAVEAVHGTVMWASPAAITSVLGSAADLTPQQRAAFGSLRLVLGAGAPVKPALLHGMRSLCPQADVRTPYGMTEALPVCDVSVGEIDRAGPGDGVLVGRPLPGVDVRISAVDDAGRADGPLTEEAGVLGEVVVRGSHIKDRYDRLWATQRASARDSGWHRTGDLGHLDTEGRLWIGGRLAHVVTTADGPLAPVGVEQRVERLPGVRHAACVGVGPAGTQVPVLFVVMDGVRSGLAGLEVTERVREAAGGRVAAVLALDRLPVDIRHNSKVDRALLAVVAGAVLAGHQGRSDRANGTPE